MSLNEGALAVVVRLFGTLPKWVVNRTELAVIHQVSQQTLSDWLEKGMPVMDRGAAFADASYDVYATIVWRIEQEMGRASRESAKDRYYAAKATEVELDLAERMGGLLDRDKAVAEWQGHIVAARSILLGMLSQSWVSEEAKPKLQDEIYRVLRELAGDEYRVDE